MRLLDAQGTAAGKYNVTISGSSGVQVGDNNTQVSHFGQISAGRDVYHDQLNWLDDGCGRAELLFGIGADRVIIRRVPP